MEMCIEKGKPIKDIQREFTDVYPFLKIELVSKEQLSSKYVNGTTVKGECYHININGTRTVADLEEDFKTNLNIPIQVFRRAGSLWIETSLTEDWTLEQQNREGELFSSIQASFGKK